MVEQHDFIKLCRNNKIKIKKYTPYPFRLYFTVDNQRYLLGDGFGEIYEEYSMLARVHNQKRYVIETIAESYRCMEIDLFLKNGQKFNYKKDVYSYIDIDRFVDSLEDLLEKIE